MGLIEDSLEAAEQAASTRPIPKSAPAQMRALVRSEKGSTRRAAQRLAISQRTVERYVKGQIRTPRPQLGERLATEVRRSWQPRVRARARRRAATTTGITVETRARFGFMAAPGSTDDPRMRRITQNLPPAYAQRLFDAREAGATERQLQSIIAQGLGEQYFRDGGRRADGLEVELQDIDYVQLDLGS